MCAMSTANASSSSASAPSNAAPLPQSAVAAPVQAQPAAAPANGAANKGKEFGAIVNAFVAPLQNDVPLKRFLQEAGVGCACLERFVDKEVVYFLGEVDPSKKRELQIRTKPQFKVETRNSNVLVLSVKGRTGLTLMDAMEIISLSPLSSIMHQIQLVVVPPKAKVRQGVAHAYVQFPDKETAQAQVNSVDAMPYKGAFVHSPQLDAHPILLNETSQSHCIWRNPHYNPHGTQPAAPLTNIEEEMQLQQQQYLRMAQLQQQQQQQQQFLMLQQMQQQQQQQQQQYMVQPGQVPMFTPQYVVSPQLSVDFQQQQQQQQMMVLMQQQQQLQQQQQQQQQRPQFQMQQQQQQQQHHHRPMQFLEQAQAQPVVAESSPAHQNLGASGHAAGPPDLLVEPSPLMPSLAPSKSFGNNTQQTHAAHHLPLMSLERVE